jgi:uncharacterized protein (TIGR02145 family)
MMKARINLIHLILATTIISLSISCNNEDDNEPLTLTDLDGNIYQTVKIGTQVWQVENLKTTKYNNGNPIPLVTSNTEWDNLTSPAYCWYNNDQDTYAETYGAIYNWYTVETGRLCPSGWHVPAESEWKVLTDYLAAEGHSGTEGTVLKSTSSWYNEGNGTDDYGFKGLPGGYRTYNGSQNGFNESLGKSGHWWSSTEHFSLTDAVYMSLYHFESKAISYHLYKTNGVSVRCLKD